MTTMTTITATPGRPDWTTGPLYQLMFDALPTYHTKSGILDVLTLKDELKRSHEAVYKWLRTSRLTPENVRRIRGVINQPGNLAALSKLKRKAPDLREFDAFLYADADV